MFQDHLCPSEQEEVEEFMFDFRLKSRFLKTRWVKLFVGQIQSAFF